MKKQTKRTMSNRELGYYDDTSKRSVQAAEGTRQAERRENVVRESVKAANPTPNPGKAKRKPRQKGATSLEEARTTKHKGSKGETAYGGRMQPSPYGKD